MPSVELEGLGVGDRGEERPLVYTVTYETKHETITSIHASRKGAEGRVLAIAKANLRSWYDDRAGITAVQDAIDDKYAEGVCDLWSELTGDTEFLTIEQELLDD